MPAGNDDGETEGLYGPVPPHELRAFVARLSHDLKSPLAAAMGFANLLGRTLGDGEPRARDLIERMEVALDREHRLVEDLLTFTNVRYGPSPTGTVALDDVVDAAKRQVGGRVVVRVAGGLPVVRGSSDRLLELVIQVLRNATDRMADPFPPTVDIRAERVDDVVRLVFVDDAAPIPAADRDHAFEAFHRFSDHDKYFAGSGLGLSIVDVIARCHGGGASCDRLQERNRIVVVLAGAVAPGPELSSESGT